MEQITHQFSIGLEPYWRYDKLRINIALYIIIIFTVPFFLGSLRPPKTPTHPSLAHILGLVCFTHCKWPIKSKRGVDRSLSFSPFSQEFDSCFYIWFVRDGLGTM